MSTFSDLLSAATEIEETNLNKNEKIPEVVAAFKKCYDFDPSNEETKRKYLSYFKRQFELEHIKKNQEELKVLGNVKVQQDRYEEAVIIYDASIDLDPSIESAAPIYSNRSLCFFNLGRFQEAEDDGCMAIFLRPEFARGYRRRGNAAMKLEKWKEASDAFEKYFELDPENAKSDPELVKNKNLVKKQFHQNEAEIRRHATMIEKTRAELMAIKDENERKLTVMSLMSEQLDKPQKFDVDLVRTLVECGADLAPTPLTPEQVAFVRRQYPTSKEDTTMSFLVSLLLFCGEVSPKTAPHFDELIFFVIEKMLRQDVPFVGCELCLACNGRNAGHINSKLLRVLLETNKFDVNRNFGAGRFAPLVSLVQGMKECVEMPREAPECLHLLLNWKGINVNAVSGCGTLQMTALAFVRHPEVAKILIRYGANVNAVFNDDSGNSTNVLDRVLSFPHNPELEELVRLLIQSGARLLPSGRDKKSSATITRILCCVEDQQTKKKAFISEEVLQMILQLNLHQGLLFRWQCRKSSLETPFLLNAIQAGSPLRFVELLCAMTPEPMKETGRAIDGTQISAAVALALRIQYEMSTFNESMQVLGVMLEHEFDLYSVLFEITAFDLLWRSCRQANQDLNLLKKTIIEKRGYDEFERCMKTLK